MTTEGVRPRKLWHWAAIAVIGATAWANPGGTAELAVTALDRVGTVLGSALDRAGYDGDSEYFTDPAAPTDPNNPAELGPIDPAPPDLDSTDGDASRAGLEGTADRLVVEVVELHELVEETLEPANAPPEEGSRS